MKTILLAAAVYLCFPVHGQNEEYRDVLYANSKKNAVLYDRSNPLSFINFIENAILVLQYSDNHTGMSLADAEIVQSKGTDLSKAENFYSYLGESSDLPLVTDSGQDSVIIFDDGRTEYVYPRADTYYFLTKGFDDIIIREKKTYQEGKVVYIPSEIILRKKFNGIKEPVIAGRMPYDLVSQVPVKTLEKLPPAERDRLLAEYTVYLEKAKNVKGIPEKQRKYLKPEYELYSTAFEYFGESDFFTCRNWKSSGKDFPQFTDFINVIRNNPDLVIRVDSLNELTYNDETGEIIFTTDPETGFTIPETHLRTDTSYFYSGNLDDVYITKELFFTSSPTGWQERFTGLFFTKDLVPGEKPVVLAEINEYAAGEPDPGDPEYYVLMKFRQFNDPGYKYVQNLQLKNYGSVTWGKQLLDHSLEWKQVKISE